MSDDLSPSLIAFAENEWGEFWTANERLSLAEFAAIARAEGRAETEALRAEIAQHMQAAQAEVARLRAAIQEFGKGEGADFRAAVVRACDERIDAYKHEAREARREVEALRAALEPFATRIEWLQTVDDDEYVFVVLYGRDRGDEPEFTVSDFRRARAALAEFGQGEGEALRAAVVRACDERIDAYKHEAREARREVDALRQLAMKNASTMEVARRRLRGDFGAKTSELNMAIDETRAALAAAKEKAGDPKAAGQVHAEARPDVKG